MFSSIFWDAIATIAVDLFCTKCFLLADPFGRDLRHLAGESYGFKGREMAGLMVASLKWTASSPLKIDGW